MDASARYELESIKSELNSIISELEEISYGVRNDFKGIGSEQCANCIDRVLQKYYKARTKLNNIDTSSVAAGYGGGGGGGRSF